jgi:hypothetical protein
MGRYYSGDIEGKFWFAVQSSDAADRFGVMGSEPNYITYYFEEEHLPDVEAELEKIVKGLGENFEKIKNFFDNATSYNDVMVANALGINDEKTITHMISEYADYTLGVKIRDQLRATGSCVFDAEL